MDKYKNNSSYRGVKNGGEMRIVNIISCCVPGGAEILVKDTLKLLAQDKKNEIELWVISELKDSNLEATEAKIEFEKKYCQELEEKGILVRHIKKRANKDLVKTWLTLRKMYKEFKPHILHSHLEHVTVHTLIGTLGLKSKKIQTIHNTKIMYPKLQKYFIKYFLDYFISISPEVTKELCKLQIKDKKIVEVLNGVNIEKFKNIERKYKEKRNYIAIGRMVEQKNYFFMLNVFQQFLESLTLEEKKNCKLYIVGEGPKEKEIKVLLKELGLNDSVELLGVRNDISELLKKADIYLMTSKWEGFSISLIEAAACGLPIIATDVGSNSLIVKDGKNGYLIENYNEKKYVEAIKKLDKLNYLKFSKNSREIAEKYSLINSLNKLKKIYED